MPVQCVLHVGHPLWVAVVVLSLTCRLPCIIVDKLADVLSVMAG